MATTNLILCIFITFAWSVLPTIQVSTPADKYYVAGVVEFQRSNDEMKNLADYLRIIKSQEAAETDIIVFPEATLNSVHNATYVPYPKDKVVPCVEGTLYEPFLTNISCAARATNKYIVINIVEKKNCTAEDQRAHNDPRPCALNGVTLYNTNVVFSRNGSIISRYRKWNLFGEYPKNTTLHPEFSIFDTDFGVKFGQFICFDMLFYEPALKLVRDYGITDIIYPTMWFSELPFLTAVQTQQAWAYRTGVNLLAAGASNPSVGSTGTGIYHGVSGALVAVMNNQGEQKLYVAKVPKDVSEKVEETRMIPVNPNSTTVLNLKHFEIFENQTRILESKAGNFSANLCYEDLCCDFDVDMTPINVTQGFTYRLYAFSGKRSYDSKREGHFKACAVIACPTSDVRSCGTVPPNMRQNPKSIRFNYIKVYGIMDTVTPMLSMPTSLDMSLVPLNGADEFFFGTAWGPRNRPTAISRLQKPHDDLLTFGFYVNTFNKAGSTVQPITALLIISIVLSVLKTIF